MGESNIMSDSTLYTIGTALSRAKDQDLTVQVLVEGQWLDGRVVATDGHGLAPQPTASSSRWSECRASRPFACSVQPSTRAQAYPTAPANSQPTPGPRVSEVDSYAGRPELTMASQTR